jgi:hypothetical protein
MMAELNTSKPLKPKASAVWLIENTTLSFEQIAEYTGLHPIEIQALADEEVGKGIIGEDPVKSGELAQSEIERCEKDGSAFLKINHTENPAVKIRAKGPRYTPVSKRNDKPDAIAYLLKQHPELKDSQICKLVGTTKPTIAAIRDRSHPNSANIRPRHPAEIGLCTFEELDKASRRSLKAMGKDPDAEAQRRAEEAAQAYESANPESDEKKLNKFDFSNFLKSAS